jgi:late competence protein required for DNA uptake (superfamily II DNA/RNA helicase)
MFLATVESLESELATKSDALLEMQREGAEQRRQLHVYEARLKCRICFERLRDALVMPCMHFMYCHQCLVEHGEASRNCPACRSPISDVLQCKLDI